MIKRKEITIIGHENTEDRRREDPINKNGQFDLAEEVFVILTI